MEKNLPSETFKDRIRLKIHSPDEMLQLCSEEKEYMLEDAWFVMDIIMAHVKEHDIKEGDEFDNYFSVIEFVTRSSSSKDVYLGILEQFDPHIPCRYILALLPALKIVLTGLAKTDIRACLLSLDMGYSALSYYIDSMNLPEYKEFDPMVSKTLDFEESVLFNLLVLALDAFKVPIKEIVSHYIGKNSKDVKNFYCESFGFLCNVLVILNKLDVQLYSSKENKSIEKESNPGNSPVKVDHIACEYLHQTCDSLMELIHTFHTPLNLVTNQYWCGNFLKLQSQNEEAQNEEIKASEIARGCYLYLLFCLRPSMDMCPKIWSYEYLLCLCMKDVVCLMSQKSPVTVHKGLELCRFIVNQLDVQTLSYEKISSLSPSYADIQHENADEITEEKSNENNDAKNIVRQIYNSIIGIAVFVPAKSLRTRAVEFLTKFTDKFLHSDRYIIIKYLLKTTRHSGVAGVLIHYVKEKINEEFNNNEIKLFLNPAKFKIILGLVTNLPNGTETDLLVYSDQIMPALNLLRFLLLRDKKNKSGVVHLKDDMKSNFLGPLRTGLNLSRAHYEAELKNCQKKKNKSNDSKSKSTELTINGLPTHNLPIAQQKQTINAALTSFDMMEIVLSRVEELFSF